MPQCECAERATVLARIYDERYLVAAEAADRGVQTLAQQVRDDLAALAGNCEAPDEG